MREEIRAFLWRLVKNHWFWIGVILLFILAILFDFSVAVIWVIKTLFLTHWEPVLFWIGISSAVLGAIGGKRKIWESKTLRDLGLLFFVIALVLGIRDYGFWRGIVFIVGILFLGRLLSWLVPKRKVLKRVS